MTTRKKFRLLVAGALLGLAGWLVVAVAPWPVNHPVSARPPVKTLEPSRGGDHVRETTAAASSAALAVPAKPSRSEAAAYLRSVYRQEQLAHELDLEQQRYGKHFWEAECAGLTLARLQRVREAMIRQLTAEANQVLADLYPGEAGEPLTFPPLFDADHAGPNLSGLSPASRQQWEAGVLAGLGNGVADPASLLAVAQQVLSADELAVYRTWNEPVAAVLREQIVGFNPTEVEFTAILHVSQVTGENTDPAVTEASLRAVLGTERFAAWQALQEPAMRTALRDLQRLGLPLEQAGWLAATRLQAAVTLQQTAQDPSLSDSSRQLQVAQVQRDYGEAIAVKLSLPSSSLDELSPIP